MTEATIQSTAATPLAASPLAAFAAVQGGVSLQERPLCGKITLRGELGDAGFVAACEQALGAAPQASLAPPQALSAGTLYWMGPNEWLLHCELSEVPTLLTALAQAAQGAHLAAVDVSDYYLVLRLQGADARDVLTRGTPLDVHPQVFTAGEAVNTRFAKCSVLLYAVADDCFDLQVRWSHAEYLWQFIEQAASQYNG